MTLVLAFLIACSEPAAPPPEPPPDPCETAWRELSTLAAAVPSSKAPDATSFRTACTALPLASRDCLSPRIHATDATRCQSALDALTDDQKAALSSALDGSRRKP